MDAPTALRAAAIALRAKREQLLILMKEMGFTENLAGKIEAYTTAALDLDWQATSIECDQQWETLNQKLKGAA